MFFSVRNTIKIEGKIYRPCICYAVTEYLKLTINKLVAEGKADRYEERVFFCNGKIVEKKVEVEEVQPKPKTKKMKKEKTVPAVDTTAVDTTAVDTTEDDIPSPEEIADNEDF